MADRDPRAALPVRLPLLDTMPPTSEPLWPWQILVAGNNGLDRATLTDHGDLVLQHLTVSPGQSHEFLVRAECLPLLRALLTRCGEEGE